MKGLAACAVLAEMERRSGKPASKLFDLMGGTSVGGIIALSLAAGNSASDTLSFFTEDGPKIFKGGFGSSPFLRFLTFRGYYKYDPAPLVECLQRRFQSKKMSDARIPIIVPATDRISRDEVFFKSDDIETMNYPMWQVGRATSAAQTYFPPYAFSGWNFFDGGTGANNPSVCVYAQAISKWGMNETYRMLFLGCGEISSVKVPANPGPVAILGETVQMMLSCTDGIPDYQMRQFLGNSYASIQPKGITTGLDDASPDALSSLNQIALKTIQDNSDLIDRFCQ